MKKTSWKAARALWATGLFAIPLVLTLEIVTRVDQAISYGAPLIGQYSYDSALKIQTESGVVGKPNGRYEKWELNSYGFRGPEFKILPLPGVTRIVCLGASETFGLFEQKENEWPRQLERMLRADGHRVEVLNAALAGMTMRRRIDHFQEMVLPLQPDLAVVMLEYPSYFGAARTATARDPGRTLPGSGSEPRSAGVQFRFFRKFKDAVVPRLPAVIGDAMRQAAVRVRVSRHRKALGSSFQAGREVSPEQLSGYEEDLVRFLTLAKENRIRVLLLAPAVRVDEETTLDFSANWPFIHPDWLGEAKDTFLDATLSVVASEDVAVLDLDPALEGDKEKLMPDAFHFTDAGAGLVAEAVATLVEERPGWLEGGSTS